MDIVIALNDAEQKRVLAAANRLHMPAAELLKKVALDHLPQETPTPSTNYDIDEILHKMQQEDGTVLAPDIPTHVLHAQWAEEDARKTDEELEAEEKLWAEIEQSLLQRPGLQLRDIGQ